LFVKKEGGKKMNDWIYICRSKTDFKRWRKFPKALQKIILGTIADRYVELAGECKLVEILERAHKKNKRIYFFARRYDERR
jgi:hypothetical protein